MKTEQPQPAPVLAWHREAAHMLAADSKRFCEISVFMTPDWIAEHIAAHDPHAETVGLLTAALSEIVITDEDGDVIHANARLVNKIRAHLAKLKGTQ